jgi:hypothetical protein
MADFTVSSDQLADLNRSDPSGLRGLMLGQAREAIESGDRVILVAGSVEQPVGIPRVYTTLNEVENLFALPPPPPTGPGSFYGSGGEGGE